MNREKLPRMTGLKETKELTYQELYNRGLIQETHCMERMALMQYEEKKVENTLDEIAEDIAGRIYLSPSNVKGMISRARKREVYAQKKEQQK